MRLGPHGFSRPSSTCTNLLCLHGRRRPGDPTIRVIQLGTKERQESGFPLNVSPEQPLGRATSEEATAMHQE